MWLRVLRTIWISAALSVTVGCGDDDPGGGPQGEDAAVVDSGASSDSGVVADSGVGTGTDAGTVDDAGVESDAGVVADAGSSTVADGGMIPDAGTGTVADAGPADGGAGDAGPLDGGGLDGGPVDAGPIDGAVDAGNGPDAGPVDGAVDAGGGPVDAGEADAGEVDGGTGPGTLVEEFRFQTPFISCGLGFREDGSTVWLAVCNSNEMQIFNSNGTYVDSSPLPGTPGDNADIDFAPEGFTLGTTAVAEDDLLFINGEGGAAQIFLIDLAVSTATAAELTTAFGDGFVVGGAYNPITETFFLLQEASPFDPDERNRVEEIDPVDGARIGGFQTTPDFEIVFGDLDVCASTGHVFLVSSEENSIAEFTEEGDFVDTYDLPASVESGGSGLALVGTTGEAWMVGTSTTVVWRLSGLPCPNL